MTKENTNSIYVLICEINGQQIPFYIGRSHNIKQRQRQHARAANDPTHAEYNTYKYQMIRQIQEEGDKWWLEELYEPEEVTDKTDEYCAILQTARYNIENGYGEAFWGNPLTNMKAGDFLSEMLQDKNLHSYTRSTVNDWIEKRNAQREVTYERENHAPSRNKALIDSMNKKAEEMRQAQREKTEAKIKRLERDLENTRRNSPHLVATIAEIEKEISKLRIHVNLFDEN